MKNTVENMQPTADATVVARAGYGYGDALTLRRGLAIGPRSEA